MGKSGKVPQISPTARSRARRPLGTRGRRGLGIGSSYWKEVPARLASVMGLGCLSWNGLFTAFAGDVLLLFLLFPFHLQHVKRQWRVLRKSVAYSRWLMYVSGILTVPYRVLTPRITEPGEQLHESEVPDERLCWCKLLWPPPSPRQLHWLPPGSACFFHSGQLSSALPCVFPFSV